MWYITAAAMMLVVSSAFGLSKLRNSGVVKSQLIHRMFDNINLGSLSMSEINTLLARLERTEQPEPVMGAMCYEAMAYPDVAEYICPECGEKTIYSDSRTAFIEWELQGCRRMVDSINALTEFNVSLDETLLCDFCSESIEDEPAVLLRVSSSDSTETVNSVSVLDLRMLESFLQGNLFYTTFNDGEEPLQDYSGRIRELLGVSDI